MKSFDTLLSRFCYKHPRFGIPNLMTVIVAGTVLVYLLDMFSTTILFSDLLGVSLPSSLSLTAATSSSWP